MIYYLNTNTNAREEMFVNILIQSAKLSGLHDAFQILSEIKILIVLTIGLHSVWPENGILFVFFMSLRLLPIQHSLWKYLIPGWMIYRLGQVNWEEL